MKRAPGLIQAKLIGLTRWAGVAIFSTAAHGLKGITQICTVIPTVHWDGTVPGPVKDPSVPGPVAVPRIAGDAALAVDPVRVVTMDCKEVKRGK